MEKKFIVPASTMLGGILVWVIFLISNGSENSNIWSQLLIGLATGGLILFSGIRCHKVGGPRGGNVFRAVLLLVLAVLSYFLFGFGLAGVLFLASILTGLLVFKNPVSGKAT